VTFGLFIHLGFHSSLRNLRRSCWALQPTESQKLEHADGDLRPLHRCATAGNNTFRKAISPSSHHLANPIAHSAGPLWICRRPDTFFPSLSGSPAKWRITAVDSP